MGVLNYLYSGRVFFIDNSQSHIIRRSQEDMISPSFAVLSIVLMVSIPVTPDLVGDGNVGNVVKGGKDLVGDGHIGQHIEKRMANMDDDSSQSDEEDGQDYNNYDAENDPKESGTENCENTITGNGKIIGHGNCNNVVSK